MSNSFNIENYVPVQDRVLEFYRDFPNGSIRTFLAVRDGPEVVFEARVYRSTEDAAMGVYTSGWAREVEGKSSVNRTSHLEVGETSAVGRALANLGYATSADRPSREEMLKVARQKREHEAMLDFIRSAGPQVPEDAEFQVNGGLPRNLKEYVRENWSMIKEHVRVAYRVVEAIEVATGAEFEPQEQAAAS